MFFSTKEMPIHCHKNPTRFNNIKVARFNWAYVVIYYTKNISQIALNDNLQKIKLSFIGSL